MYRGCGGGSVRVWKALGQFRCLICRGSSSCLPSSVVYCSSSSPSSRSSTFRAALCILMFNGCMLSVS